MHWLATGGYDGTLASNWRADKHLMGWNAIGPTIEIAG